MDAVTFRTIGLGQSPRVSPAFQALVVSATLLSACSVLVPVRPTPPPAPAVAPEPIDVLPAPEPPPPIAKPAPAPPKASPGRFGRDDISSLARTADAVPRDEALHPSANRPYVQGKRRFVPLTARKPFSQRGLASWYGHPFHGRRTATGERYDMREMTAAHPTLPLPSYARVRSLETGRTIIVRVNDRGPFIGERVIDLSLAAAARLGFTDRGVAAVQVELIVPDDDGSEVAGRVAAGDGVAPAPAATADGTGRRTGATPALATTAPSDDEPRRQ